MGLRMIWDFSNAKDPETGEPVTREMLEEEFGPQDEQTQEITALGVTITIEETT